MNRTDKQECSHKDMGKEKVRRSEHTMRIELTPKTRSKAPWIAILGFFLPILVGLLFRFYFQLRGQPVIELTWFLGGGLRMTIILLTFLIADIPFMIASVIARRLLRVEPISTATTRVASVVGMVMGTAVSSIVLFLIVWSSQYWEDIIFMFGAVALLLYMLPCMIIGLGLGWVVGRLLQSRENHRLRPLLPFPKSGPYV